MEKDQEDTIQVPDSAPIRCPAIGFDLVRAARCATCPSFAGLADRFPGSDVKFAKRYLVQCKAEPVKRELFELVEGEA